MDNFESILNKAVTTCEGQFKYQKEFSRIYSFTTENINGYLDYFDLKNKKLLTVGSSGDQVLNAYYKGCQDITLYDINEYAKYYVNLKIAAITSINYNEFQNFFFKQVLNEKNNKDMFNVEAFNKIKTTLKLLDYESFLFFDELFSIYKPNQIRENLFDDDESRYKVITNFNLYLKSEENYNKLKHIIKKINFKYINGNIFKNNIDDKYDNIFLSNLCTTTNINNLKKLLAKLDKNNLNQNGSILLGYLWKADFNSETYNNDWKEIYKLPITKELLKKYITEYYHIKNDRHYIFGNSKTNDLVLIYRKK